MKTHKTNLTYLFAISKNYNVKKREQEIIKIKLHLKRYQDIMWVLLRF